MPHHDNRKDTKREIRDNIHHAIVDVNGAIVRALCVAFRKPRRWQWALEHGDEEAGHDADEDEASEDHVGNVQISPVVDLPDEEAERNLGAAVDEQGQDPRGIHQLSRTHLSQGTSTRRLLTLTLL